MRQMRVVLGGMLSMWGTRFSLLCVLMSFVVVRLPDWPLIEFRGTLDPLLFPEVRPLNSDSDLRLGFVSPYQKWGEIRGEATDPRTGQGILISGSGRAFAFLPRHSESQMELEPGQPENFHELVPQLERLGLYGCSLTAEDWRDVAQLEKLWFLEIGDIVPVGADESAEAAAAADALAGLPDLRQLNLTGNTWIRLGGLSQLESLSLDAVRLEDVFRGDVGVEFPRLRSVCLRLSEGFAFTEGQLAVLRRLEAGGLARVDLWTGRAGQRSWLRGKVDELRGLLPGVDIRSGEAGFGMFVIPGVMLFVVPLIHLTGNLLMVLLVPQNGFVPGFATAHAWGLIFFLGMAAVCGWGISIQLEIRWWAPVLLSVLLMGSFLGFRACVIRSRLGRMVLPVLWIGAVLVATGLAMREPGLFLQAMMGDVRNFNVSLICAAMLSLPASVIACRRLFVYASEQPGLLRAGWVGAGFGMSARDTVLEQTLATDSLNLKPVSVSRGDLAEQLRAGNRLSAKGLWRGLGLILPMFLFPSLTIFLNPHTAISGARIVSLLASFVSVAFLVHGGFRGLAWSQRGQRLGVELLFPMGREQFWCEVRRAVMRDLSWVWAASGVCLVLVSVMEGWMALAPARFVMQLLFLTGHVLMCCSCFVVGLVLRPVWRAQWYTLVFAIEAVMWLTLVGVLMDTVVFQCLSGLTAVAGVVVWVTLPRFLRRREVLV